MLGELKQIIEDLELIHGEVLTMTAGQLDEFARNVPEDKISCSIFGLGGYGRNEAGAMTKQFRICLLKMMPINFDLLQVDESEIEMSKILFKISDELKDSEDLNFESETGLTPELLRFDRTTLLVFFDVTLFENSGAICNN